MNGWITRVWGELLSSWKKYKKSVRHRIIFLSLFFFAIAFLDLRYRMKWWMTFVLWNKIIIFLFFFFTITLDNFWQHCKIFQFKIQNGRIDLDFICFCRNIQVSLAIKYLFILFIFFISVSLCHEVVKELIDFFVSLSILFCCCYFVQIIGIKKKNNYKIRISPSASINLL